MVLQSCLLDLAIVEIQGRYRAVHHVGSRPFLGVLEVLRRNYCSGLYVFCSAGIVVLEHPESWCAVEQKSISG
jgi:hypothetical protein